MKKLILILLIIGIALTSFSQGKKSFKGASGWKNGKPKIYDGNEWKDTNTNDGNIDLGDTLTDGCVRITVIDDGLLFTVRESGVWDTVNVMSRSNYIPPIEASTDPVLRIPNIGEQDFKSLNPDSVLVAGCSVIDDDTPTLTLRVYNNQGALYFPETSGIVLVEISGGLELVGSVTDLNTELNDIMFGHNATDDYSTLTNPYLAFELTDGVTTVRDTTFMFINNNGR